MSVLFPALNEALPKTVAAFEKHWPAPVLACKDMRGIWLLSLVCAQPEVNAEAAEQALGVSFPSDYRAFLSVAGAFFGHGCEIAGIVPAFDDDQSPLWTDVVSWNQQLRSRQKNPIPAAYIAVASDGGDDRFYIDTTRRDERGRSPVVVLGPGADYETVAGDFFEFVIQEINAVPKSRT